MEVIFILTDVEFEMQTCGNIHIVAIINQWQFIEHLLNAWHSTKNFT